MMKVLDFNEIMLGMQNSAQENYGDDFNVSNTSNWYRLNQPIAMLLVEFSQKIKDVENANSIYKATGQKLDDLLGNFLFPRKQQTAAIGQWKTSNSTPSIVVEIGTLTLERSDGVTYKNTNKVTIDSLGVGIFDIQCETPGSIGNSEINTINKIKTPVTGIVSGTNLNSVEGGQDQETDLAYLNRYLLTKGSESYWNLDGIYGEILKVSGVKSAFVSCNRENTTDANGWLPHSRIYVVDGGTDKDIAEAIYRKTDRAIEENGDVSIPVKDSQGFDRIVKFYRPITQIIDYKFVIIGTGDTPSITTKLKEYIDSVRVGGLITATNAIEVLRQNNLLIGIQNIDISFSEGGQGQWAKTYQLAYNKKPSGNLVVV